MILRSGKIINSSIMPAAATAKSFSCLRCNLQFPEKKLVFEHDRKEHPKCNQCKERYLSLAELQDHQQVTEHCYCRKCDIYFPNLMEHLTHARSTTHTTPYHCCDCGREYTNQETLSYHCCECDKVFRKQKLLQRHLSSKKHIRKVGVLTTKSSRNLPHKCNKCDETFQDKKQLKKHMSSHRNIPCPTGGKCNRKFAIPSALLNHLESGCCSSGMTRAKMHLLVFAHDPNRYITSVEAVKSIQSSEHISANQTSHLSDSVEALAENPSTDQFTPLPLVFDDDDSFSEWSAVSRGPLTPTNNDSDWSIIGETILTPTYSDNPSEWSFISEDHVSSIAFPFDANRDATSHRRAISQERHCQLCKPNRKPFRSVRAYQAHVNSAAHASKIFHCPLSLIPKVKALDLSKTKSFSTLGGLTQHLESGKCEGGFEMYRKAITFVEEQLKLLGFSGLKLLSN
ncbi:hypothetical protein BGAL_0017g00020 [Botrytis galanthina]|uniref:C2H2-type domain-containing protein n=1 Tax=Botrytis galanthina TaxID=278940 RepID=A0A4S8RJJ2_9HELO|nr:hypothetical protein BGAL_0017g00020 [Botrytis galanthina]